MQSLESEQFAPVAATLMLLYLALAAVLLLNMLIAMMANTFNEMWHEQRVIHQLFLYVSRTHQCTS